LQDLCSYLENEGVSLLATSKMRERGEIQTGNDFLENDFASFHPSQAKKLKQVRENILALG